MRTRTRLTLSYWRLIVAAGAVLLVVTVGLWQSVSTTTHVSGPDPAGPGVTTVHGSNLQGLLILAGIALATMAVVAIVFGRLVAARLERSFEFERRFVANVSHELRTPLATMRVWLDVAMAKPGPLPPESVALAGRIRHELDHIDTLLEGFLTLARTQQVPASDQAAVSLSGTAAAAIGQRADTASGLALTVDHEPCPDAAVTGSRTLLARMIENVIDNAIRHNEPGGWVRVREQAEGALAQVVVENGGAVLAQKEVDRLGRPFHRLGRERTGTGDGTGLGLSIVKSIAEAHGGGVALQALPGGGLRVTITLPRAEAMAGRS